MEKRAQFMHQALQYGAVRIHCSAPRIRQSLIQWLSVARGVPGITHNGAFYTVDASVAHYCCASRERSPLVQCLDVAASAMPDSIVSGTSNISYIS